MKLIDAIRELGGTNVRTHGPVYSPFRSTECARAVSFVAFGRERRRAILGSSWQAAAPALLEWAEQEFSRGFNRHEPLPA